MIITKSMKTSHEVISRTKTHRQDDCTEYEIQCSCGKTIGGWTPTQTEKEYEKHTKVK